MAKQPTEMRLEEITPTRAKDDLERSFGKNYRGMNLKRAEAIAEAMRSGRFEENGETVKYNGDGRLIDGQHRFQACVIADRPFKTWVCYNVRSDSNIDTGMPRRLGNLLRNKGHKYYHELASALSWLHRWENGTLTLPRQHVPNSELLALLKKHEPALTVAVDAVGQMNKKLGIRGPLSVVVYKARLCLPEEAKWFEDRLSSGLELKKTDAVYHLRRRLTEQKRDARLTEVEKLAFVIKAWNFTVEGKPCQILSWRAAGPGAEDFPTMLTRRPDSAY